MNQNCVSKNGVTRREFLKKTALGTVGIMGGAMLGCSPLFADDTAKHKRPNVLFIICDDLNDSIAGMGGHPQARTPNVNRLMQRGVRFTNAQSNNPICGPSRASFLSGLYPSTTGEYGYDQLHYHWRDNTVLKNSVKVMEHFMANGYDCYGTGKIFHNGHEDYSVWRRDDGFDGNGIKPSHGPKPSAEKNFFKPTGHPSMPKFYHDNQFRCFGSLADVPDVPPDPEKGTSGCKGWWLFGQPFRYVSETDRDLMPDELNAKWTVERLKEKHEKPFFIMVGMNRPHTPMYAPDKYFRMFPLEEIQLPPYLENDLDDCAKILVAQAEGKKMYDDMMAHGGMDHWKKWVQAYLACVAFVDDQVGKILDALEKSPYADNTIVIFTSDHGYHMGEKDNLFKRTCWEEADRVPFVAYAPGVSKANKECDQPISLIDVYPTLVDLCGLPKHPNTKGNGYKLDGYSIRPLLEDPENGKWDGPPVALSCIHGRKHIARGVPGKPENQHFTIRSKRWRYTLCSNQEDELYDHQNDPHEWRNLAGVAEYDTIKKKLRRQLCEMAGLPYDPSWPKL